VEFLEKVTSKYKNYYSRVFADASHAFSYFCLGNHMSDNNFHLDWLLYITDKIII